MNINTVNTTDNMQSPMLQDYLRDPEGEQRLAENPQKTILLLLQGFIDKGVLAKACHNNKALVEKGFHLGRMTTILDALRDRLMLTEGTPIAYDLEELYRYADRAIQESVFEAGAFYLDSAVEIITELRDAWVEMMHQGGDIENHA